MNLTAPDLRHSAAHHRLATVPSDQYGFIGKLVDVDRVGRVPNVKAITSGTIIFVAAFAGSVVIATSDMLLDNVATSLADTPVGRVAEIARDLTGKIRDRTKSGNIVRIVLDICPSSDDGWNQESDLLGTIKCGETYLVRYVADKDSWEATGFNEGAGDKITALAKAGAARANQVVIWGVPFDFDSDLSVSSDGVMFGRLELTENVK